MPLSIQWYDVVCGAIVGFSAIASLWVIWRKEGGSRVDDNKLYLSLLAAGRDGDGRHVAVTPVGHVDSSWLWTSCWAGVHPGWLLVVRLGSLAAMGTFLAWDIEDWDASIFVYYTEWTFTLVMFYFALGSIASAYGCWVHVTKPTPGRDLEETTYSSTNTTYTDKGRSRYTEEDILQRAGFWGYIMQIAYQTSAGAVILTDIVFWCMIVPFMANARLSLNLLMGCMHTMNALFLLIDASLNNLPFPWFRLSYFVLWTSIYVVFQWVIHACGFPWWPYPFLELSSGWSAPWWPYPFLELSSGWSAPWYFGVALMHIPCYGFYALIIKGKNSMFSKLFPQAFVRSSS